MANSYRGDVDLELQGQTFTLRLTLQSLAEMEGAFDVDSLPALGERLASGRLSAADLIRILGPAIRGGGVEKSDHEIARLLPASGLAEIMSAVARLMETTFGEAEPNPI